MIENWKTRWAIIGVVFFYGVIYTVPNFFDTSKFWWPVSDRMVMGLDIQGGAHLVMQIDLADALRSQIRRIESGLDADFDGAGIVLEEVSVLDRERGRIEMRFSDEGVLGDAWSVIEDFYPEMFRQEVAREKTLIIELSELWLRDFRRNLMDQAVATIRNRVDEFGVTEPSVTSQGSDRVLVQLPGIEDVETAKELINRTARLEFMIVDEEFPIDELMVLVERAEEEHELSLSEMRYSDYLEQLNEVLEDHLPEDRRVFFKRLDGAATVEEGSFPILLKTDNILSGERVRSARVGRDDRNRPAVHFTMDAQGARLLQDLTRENIRKQMAIILDRVVISDPVLQAVLSSRGMITMGGGRSYDEIMQEAVILATSMRAGALPVSMELVEERTVGPTLGQDAIERGQRATWIAGLVVFAFLISYYGAFGVIASVGLVFNLTLVLAILSALGATLTLPGVAGLALTLGIAVDANVIIFERIKEELRKGSPLAVAMRDGFSRAFSAIIDANITSIAVCIILMYFGTGPIRGFAVTLIAGLIISMFTAIFFIRTLLELLIARWKWKLSISWLV